MTERLNLIDIQYEYNFNNSLMNYKFKWKTISTNLSHFWMQYKIVFTNEGQLKKYS